MCVPATSSSSPPPSNPSWIFHRDRAIPFGDSVSGDNATCAKVATTLAYIQDSPANLQPAILQTILEDTYIDNRGVGASSFPNIELLQGEIEKILSKGGFSIKSWERSGEDGASKYLGMTWDRKNDCYLLKFHLNLYKKFRGILSRADLDEEFLQDCSIPITKRNVLSVACQFYDSTGLAAPLMFYVRSPFSEICQNCQSSMNSVLSEVHTEKFCTAVDQILRISELSFP